jgi:uncharacterized membrane protein
MVFGLFQKKDTGASKAPVSVTTEFVPYKLKSKQRSASSFVIRVKNLTREPALSSLMINVPNQISLDSMGIVKSKEVKIGTLQPNEEKETRIEVYGDVATDKGEYTITLTTYLHYRDYAHVLNAVTKRTTLQAV